MKRILYLTFYFEPDLSAGSFRNSSLAKELAKQVGDDVQIDIFTTMPNRYSSFNEQASEKEVRDNCVIHRIPISKHQSGMGDQSMSYKTYFDNVRKRTKSIDYDLVFASSSRLFTAYLAYTIAKEKKIPLYLDIRDIFVDTMQDVLKNILLRTSVMPVLKVIEKRVFNYASHINLISKGFKPYFNKFTCESYSYFPNGIDKEFLDLPRSVSIPGNVKTIVYAGNIGKGQGLHKIIPQSAEKLGNGYRFIVIGDGGIKQELIKNIEARNLDNVELRDPVQRKDLMQIYSEADYLFMHLNDYTAFKKVLPSKVFELAAFDKPLIAGVGGYAKRFVKDEVSNSILFDPCDVDSFVTQLQRFTYTNEHRSVFIDKFRRDKINVLMATSIKEFLN